MFSAFSFFDSVFPVLFTVIFLVFFIMFIVTAVRNIGRWHKNNNSPRLSVPAIVTAKRTDVSPHHNTNTHMTRSSTWYYATFQVESGDRMEFPLSSSEYAMLAEGDRGTLSFQGTRFLSFTRT